MALDEEKNEVERTGNVFLTFCVVTAIFAALLAGFIHTLSGVPIVPAVGAGLLLGGIIGTYVSRSKRVRVLLSNALDVGSWLP